VVKSTPLVSIVTPSLNQGRFIRATIVRTSWKVDAEGAELEVLHGMASFVLPELRPIVVLEVGDLNAAGVAPSRSLVDTMLSHGYSAWEPRHGELLPHEPVEHYSYGNLVFAPGS
jgi:Methyltransferase FkbM domain